MKLETRVIPFSELQSYLDKYQDRIKFILTDNNGATSNPQGEVTLIIDIE